MVTTRALIRLERNTCRDEPFRKIPLQNRYYLTYTYFVLRAVLGLVEPGVMAVIGVLRP